MQKITSIAFLCTLYVQIIHCTYIHHGSGSTVVYEHQQGVLGSGSSSSSYLHHGPPKSSNPNPSYYSYKTTVKPVLYTPQTTATVPTPAYVTSSIRRSKPTSVTYEVTRAPILYYENVKSQNVQAAINHAFNTVVAPEIQKEVSKVSTTYPQHQQQYYNPVGQQESYFSPNYNEQESSYYSSEEEYESDFGTSSQYLPPKQIFLTPPTSLNQYYYGQYNTQQPWSNYVGQPKQELVVDPPPTTLISQNYENPIPTQVHNSVSVPQQQSNQNLFSENAAPQFVTSSQLQVHNSVDQQQINQPLFGNNDPQFLTPPQQLDGRNNVEQFNFNGNRPSSPLVLRPPNSNTESMTVAENPVMNSIQQPPTLTGHASFDNRPLLSPEVKLAPPNSPNEQPRVISGLRNEAVRSQILSANNGGSSSSNNGIAPTLNFGAIDSSSGNNANFRFFSAGR